MALKEISKLGSLIRLCSRNNDVFLYQIRCSSDWIFKNQNIVIYNNRAHLDESKLNLRCSYLFGQNSLSRYYSNIEPNKKNESKNSIRNTSKDNSKISSTNTESPENKNLSLFQRIKIMYRDYWYILGPVHLVTSAFWFGSFYYLAKSGVDIVAVMKTLGFSETITNKLEQGHSTSAYLALAYALYKIATPLRYTVTLGGTTYSINKLKELGYIKPIPPKEKLVEMYEEKKEQFKEKSDQIKERYQDNKTLLQEKISAEKCKMSLRRDKFFTSLRSNPRQRQNGKNGSKKVNGFKNGNKKISDSKQATDNKNR